jgi:hypothetical protein
MKGVQTRPLSNHEINESDMRSSKLDFKQPVTVLSDEDRMGK